MGVTIEALGSIGELVPTESQSDEIWNYYLMDYRYVLPFKKAGVMYA